jgi:hypothetical protein
MRKLGFRAAEGCHPLNGGMGQSKATGGAVFLAWLIGFAAVGSGTTVQAQQRACQPGCEWVVTCDRYQCGTNSDGSPIWCYENCRERCDCPVPNTTWPEFPGLPTISPFPITPFPSPRLPSPRPLPWR